MRGEHVTLSGSAHSSPGPSPPARVVSSYYYSLRGTAMYQFHATITTYGPEDGEEWIRPELSEHT